MFSDWAKAFARRASRFLRRSRNFHLTILLTLSILWIAAFSQLESGIPYIPHLVHFGWAMRSSSASEADTAKCLLAKGIYTVEATEATIIEPFTVAENDRGWLEEVTKRGKEREHCSAHHPYFHHLGVWNIQPIFAVPARSEAIDACAEKDLACYYDIAVNYFARRRGTVIKTRKPYRYICRAVLQQSVRQAPADYQQIQQTIRRTVRSPGSHMHMVILTTAVKIASPRRRDILCEAPTPDDTEMFKHCASIRGKPVVPLLPCGNIFVAFLRHIMTFPFQDYAIVPLAKGHTYRVSIHLLAAFIAVELIVLTALYCCLWGLVLYCIRYLETCTRDDIDCTTNDALRWLVPASHRLHGHHDNLVTEKIITPQQYADLYVRGKTRGKMYIHHLLRRFIVKNSTMDQLRVYMAEAGIDNDDGCQSQTSSESDSDHDSSPHHLVIMAVCQIFINPYEDSSLERLLELNYINGHQFARIYDTREARGSFAAGALLIRVVQGNNKEKEFLLWFCGQFQVTVNQIRRNASAVTSDMFHFHSLSLTENIFSKLLRTLSYFVLLVCVVVIAYLYKCFHFL